jgi:hypothetical protein
MIIPMAQPYGGFAKTLLERQRYPDLREYPGGPPRRPYDVTAHTLPLLMGVDIVRIENSFTAPRHRDGSTGQGFGESHRPRPRIGLYKSYAASMDEGWTRWVFDSFKDKEPRLGLIIEYTSLLDPEVRAGNLNAKYDCIIIPSQRAQQILDGLSKDRFPAGISGGLGPQGVEALKTFIADGGTVITLNDASLFAIAQLGVPVRNALDGVSSRDFYCPGSILKIEFDPRDPMTRGAPTLEPSRSEGIAWFENGPAFEPTSDSVRVIARFAEAKDLLLSGWLMGADRIAGRAAIVEVKQGRGRIIMFAFRPQYRGQSIATLPFLFNAISTSK